MDNDVPFYNVYGGTQDNATWGGPSQTNNDNGIRNSDWFTVVGGDGFQPRVDPTDPNIVYGQYQHGELFRLDGRAASGSTSSRSRSRASRAAIGTGTARSS